MGRLMRQLIILIGFLLIAATANAQERTMRAKLTAECKSALPKQFKRLAALAPRDIYSAISGVIAPDGSAFAYSMYEPGVSSQRLWIFNTASGKSRLLTPAKGLRSSPAWSPDGNSIAFVDSAPERGSMAC